MIRKYAEIFCWKNVSSFCSAKATHIFSAKKIRILYIESAKTVNKMTLNELVKLTTLWTTGPWRHCSLYYRSLIEMATTLWSHTRARENRISFGPRPKFRNRDQLETAKSPKKSIPYWPNTKEIFSDSVRYLGQSKQLRCQSWLIQ